MRALNAILRELFDRTVIERTPEGAAAATAEFSEATITQILADGGGSVFVNGM